ncbi:MAG TPA: hypothetical protein DEP82_14620 [Arthrobacter bacterium]|nr:hypothetical protein [Arthrobacter sp.]
MTITSPRDFASWMRLIERNQVTLRGMPGLVASTVEGVQNGIAAADARHPAAPIELVTQTGFYTDITGRQRVRFILDFPDVTKATDGTDITIASYELWGKDVSLTALDISTGAVAGLAVPGLTLPGLAATPANKALEAAAVKDWALVDTSAVSAFRTDDFTPGTRWAFRARAIGAGTTIPGEFSIDLTVDMNADTTPPPQPTAPMVTVSRGTITATWDGQAVTGAMPADFKYAILAHGTASSPTTEIARFGRGGGFKVVANTGYYTPQFFRLRGVDESGNLGPWSAEGVGYTTPLVDTDIILSTIDAAKTKLVNIDAGVSILSDTILTRHLVVTEDMTAALAQFLHVKAGMLDANEIWADTAWFGVADAVLVRSDMFEGKAFIGGTFTATAGGVFQTDVEDLKGVKLTATGLAAWSAGGVQTLNFDTATGNLSIQGGTFTGGMYESSAYANTGVKLSADGLKIYNSSAQLVIDANPTSATFTGTITSGFGSARAMISENIYDGRPGLKIDTGSGYAGSEPFVVSYPSGSASGYQGALYASAAWINSGANPGRLLMAADGSWSLGGTAGSIFAGNGYGSFQAAGATLYLGGNAYIQATGGSIFQAESSGAATISSSTGTTIYGGLNVSGTKNFIMDHPTRPGWELLHGATESPVSGVEYWGGGTLDATGSAVITLPEYFEVLAKPDNRQVIAIGRGATVDWTDVTNGAFTVTGAAGVRFGWMVKAERYGGDFAVEREKVVWTPPNT